MSRIEEATRLRGIIEGAVSQALTDDAALDAVTLFPSWKGGGVPYSTADRVKYGDLLYKCLQAHTSQDDWTPDTASALWVRIDDPAIEWPEWRQPTGAHDAYDEGAKVSHNGEHWISDIPANTYEPGVYGWTKAA